MVLSKIGRAYDRSVQALSDPPKKKTQMMAMLRFTLDRVPKEGALARDLIEAASSEDTSQVGKAQLNTQLEMASALTVLAAVMDGHLVEVTDEEWEPVDKIAGNKTQAAGSIHDLTVITGLGKELTGNESNATQLFSLMTVALAIKSSSMVESPK